MHKCSNCESDFRNNPGVPAEEGILVRYGEVLVAAVCPACLCDVKTGKIVLTRNEKDRLVYAQYAALAMKPREPGKPA